MMFYYRGLDLCVVIVLCGWDRFGSVFFYVYSDGIRLQGDIFSVGFGFFYVYGVLDRGYRYDMIIQEVYVLVRCVVVYVIYRDVYFGGFVDFFYVRESGWEYVSRNDVWVFYFELQKFLELEKEEEEEVSEVYSEFVIFIELVKVENFSRGLEFGDFRMFVEIETL